MRSGSNVLRTCVVEAPEDTADFVPGTHPKTDRPLRALHLLLEKSPVRAEDLVRGKHGLLRKHDILPREKLDSSGSG
jgi:hypothetical protein